MKNKITILCGIVLLLSSCQTSLESEDNWIILTDLIKRDCNSQAYYELMKYYPENIETLPYSIKMANDHKEPIAFKHVYRTLNNISGNNRKIVNDTFSFSISKAYLEEGLKYDTIDQSCLLELIAIAASKEEIDSLELVSYIKELHCCINEEAQQFLYKKFLHFYHN